MLPQFAAQSAARRGRAGRPPCWGARPAPPRRRARRSRGRARPAGCAELARAVGVVRVERPQQRVGERRSAPGVPVPSMRRRARARAGREARPGGVAAAAEPTPRPRPRTRRLNSRPGTGGPTTVATPLGDGPPGRPPARGRGPRWVSGPGRRAGSAPAGPSRPPTAPGRSWRRARCRRACPRRRAAPVDGDHGEHLRPAQVVAQRGGAFEHGRARGRLASVRNSSSTRSPASAVLRRAVRCLSSSTRHDQREPFDHAPLRRVGDGRGAGAPQPSDELAADHDRRHPRGPAVGPAVPDRHHLVARAQRLQRHPHRAPLAVAASGAGVAGSALARRRARCRRRPRW